MVNNPLDPVLLHLAVSVFRHKQDNTPIARPVSWENLCDMLTHHKEREDKDGPLWSPTAYKMGDKRKNDNVVSISCYVADVDDGTRPDELIHRWRTPTGEPLTYCLHSSHSSTAEKPKYRVVFPLAAPVPGAEWKETHRKLSIVLFGEHTDPACKDIARMYYLPASPASTLNQAFADRRDGVLLDPNAFPDPPQSETFDVRVAYMRKQYTPNSTQNAGDLPGDDYSLKTGPEEVLNLLQSAGWAEVDRRGDGVIEVRRPGKHDGISGTIGYIGTESNWFYCFTSAATLFEEDRAYKPFQVYALTQCGGDFKEAARRLGKEGYGAQLNLKEVTRTVESITKTARKNTLPKREPHENKEIPSATLRTEKGSKEYAPYQITGLLGIDSEAPDTQLALAARTVTAYGQTLCHTPQFGFLIWNGKHWKKDDKQNSGAVAMVCRLSSVIKDEAAQLFGYVSELIKENRTDDAEAMMRAAKKHLNHVRQVETEHFAQGALILSRSALSVPWQRFEPKAWVIGFDNGVWDRGMWRAHRRDDYMLELAPVSYVPEIDRREWLAVLDRITGADAPDATEADKADAADLARTLQETAGYALSGASTLRYLPWLYGPKGSGKSTIAELLMTCLGSHLATMIDPKALSDDAPRDRLGAVLWGKRFAVLSEAGGQRIEAELLKTLSGSDTLPVRFNYQEQFTAKPTHLLLCVANDPPNMNAYDDALKDRVAALPCRHALAGGGKLTFSDEGRLEAIRQNPESKLVRGFIAWAIEGLARVHEVQEVHRAVCVEAATAKFWKDTDPLTEFWETQSISELQSGIRKGELKQRYIAWASDNGIRKPLSPQKWSDACRSYGLADYFFSGGERGWKLYSLSKTESGTNTTNTTEPFPKKLPQESKKDIGEFTENTPSCVSCVSSKNSGDSVSTFDDDPFADESGEVSEGVV